MSLFFQILRDQILPIFLAAGTGAAFWHVFHPDIKSLSRVSFYILSPCLVFSSITSNNLPALEFWRIAGFALTTVLISGLLAWTVGNILKLRPSMTSALMITCMFVNGGNYGLSLNLFAFGASAMDRAIVFYLVSIIGMYSLGVFIASNGIAQPKEAFKRVAQVPALYALIFAGLLRSQEWYTPTWMYRPVNLLGEAAIPIMLLILGMQLAKVKLRLRWKWMGLTILLRMLIMPAIAFGLANLFQLTGDARRAAITEASMPTAVIVTVLALEYDLEPTLVTEAVAITTLISPLTLTPIIAMLQI